MSDAAENQHWVPKFLLKQFADTDGRVFRLSKSNDEITKPAPKNTSALPGFNEFIIEGERISFEMRLQKFETQAAPLLKQIAAKRAVRQLDGRQRQKIANFIAAQSFRTHAFLEGFGSTRERFAEILPHLYRSSFITATNLINRAWCVMVIEHDDVFYLGDNPVVMQNPNEPTNASGLGFDIPGVEIFLPIAPKVALYMPCREFSRDLIFWNNVAQTAHRAMRVTTMLGHRLTTATPDSIQWCQGMIKNGAELAAALQSGGAINASPENVENLNYMQCAWASLSVYSQHRDFTFARRVFREQPQYRGHPRTAVAQMRFKPTP